MRNSLHIARWLQLRGAAIQALHIWTPDWRWLLPEVLFHPQAGSLLFLPQLHGNLQHLSISGGHNKMIPERHLYALELLPQLTDLTLNLRSDGTWNEETLKPLKDLTSLTSLDLQISRMMGPLLVSPSLTQLSKLRNLQLTCSSSGDAECCNQESQEHLMGTISQLTGLRSLELTEMVESMPAELGALLQLTSFELRSPKYRPPFFIPPSFSWCTRLRHLRFSHLPKASDETWQQVCRALLLMPRLKSLHIHFSDLSQVQPCSWSLPPRLTSLQLADCGMTTIPAAVCALKRLQDLWIGGSWVPGKLTCLPQGAYLRKLRKLIMDAPGLGGGPEALKDAKRLRSLMVNVGNDYNPAWRNEALHHLLPEGCSISFH